MEADLEADYNIEQRYVLCWRRNPRIGNHLALREKRTSRDFRVVQGSLWRLHLRLFSGYILDHFRAFPRAFLRSVLGALLRALLLRSSEDFRAFLKMFLRTFLSAFLRAFLRAFLSAFLRALERFSERFSEDF